MITIKTKLIGIDPGSTRTNPPGWALIEINDIDKIQNIIKDYTKNELKDEIQDIIVKNTEILSYGTLNIKNEKECLRLSIIFNQLYEIIKEKDIDLYTYEKQYGPSGKSLKVISQVIGALRLALNNNDITYFNAYTPNHIKKIMTGNGRANKDDIKDKIIDLYNIDKNIKKDESDAIAIAYTAIYHLIKGD